MLRARTGVASTHPDDTPSPSFQGGDASSPDGLCSTAGVAGGFRLFDVAPDADAALKAEEELAELAPEVHRWWRRADPARRERLAEVLGRLVAGMRRFGR